MSGPATSLEALAEEARQVAAFHERERRLEARHPSSDGQPRFSYSASNALSIRLSA